VSLPRLDSDRLAVVGQTLERLVEAGVIEGAALGVGDAAGNSWFATAGHVSVDGQRQPASESHRFLLTSVTKTFTATQVLLLVEDGLLDLDAPVAAYLPEFAAHGKSTVTTRHLLTHTSGLSDVSNLIEAAPAERAPEDYIAAALGTGLAFEPGEGWAYCSPGFWVMVELVNRLRETPYADDLQHRIAQPLGLAHTSYQTTAPPLEHYVDARTDGAWDEHLPEQVRRAAYPAGGLLATAPDLVRFGQAFLDGGASLVSAPTRALLRECHATGWNMGRAVEWSLGWERPGPGNLQSPRTIFHHGASGTGLWVDADNELAVTLLTADWWLPYQRHAEVVNSVFGALRA
jgi:CubicO group peptidase (beta-lactamase class C family)